ncbi:MAG: hypothetical protein WCS21_07780 [Lachnospiraceae bacterium]
MKCEMISTDGIISKRFDSLEKARHYAKYILLTGYLFNMYNGSTIAAYKHGRQCAESDIEEE